MKHKFEPVRVAPRFKPIVHTELPSDAILARYTEEGERLFPGWHGFAVYNHELKRQLIFLPKITTIDECLTFLHECGHAKLDHARRSLLPHVEEYEAWHYCYARARKYGIPAHRQHIKDSKLKVLRNCQQDAFCGYKINPIVLEWAQSETHIQRNQFDLHPTCPTDNRLQRNSVHKGTRV